MTGKLTEIAFDQLYVQLFGPKVTAYDGTHGYSDQYIVEQEVFLSAAKEAGLTPDNRFQARYPDSDLATVTVNLLHAA